MAPNESNEYTALNPASKSETAPEYLLIGHIAHDETPNGPKLGGTVSYASAAVMAMGADAAIVTSAHPQEEVLSALPAVRLHIKPAASSTVFINTYANDKRRQVMPKRALTLGLEDVPSAWRAAKIVHLGPLDDEVDPELAFAFPQALVAATPQGWMRDWDADGVIRPKPWAYAERLLPQLDAAVFSEEDIHWDQALEAHYASLAKLLVITRAAQGCTVYQQGQSAFNLPAPQVTVVDATGAGDVFTGAFLLMLNRTGNVRRAAAVAVQLASQSVTRVGMEGAPTPAEIEQVLAATATL